MWNYVQHKDSRDVIGYFIYKDNTVYSYRYGRVHMPDLMLMTVKLDSIIKLVVSSEILYQSEDIQECINVAKLDQLLAK